MNNLNIYYSKDFKQQWDRLPKEIKNSAIEKEKLLKENFFHPSLRLHPLKGRLRGMWSMSVNMQYRIIIQLEEKIIVFVSIGKHDIYRNL
jgi:addiction module RelE/StbE family toxin